MDYPAAGTIFDALTTHGISWANYHNVNRASVVLKRLLGVHGLIALRRLAQLGRWLPGVTNAVRGNKSFTADLYPLGLARCVRHLRTTPQFFADAAAGTLPSVSIVDPDFGAYSEENPQDIAAGRVLRLRGGQRGDERAGLGVDAAAVDLRRARRLLRSRAAAGRGRAGRRPRAELAAVERRGRARLLRLLSPKSLKALENADDGPVTYERYGFRVPAVIVSPYARPDFVLSDVLDHTSVLKLIEEKWNLPPLTHRDAAAVSPLGALDLTAPPAFLTPPLLPDAKGGPVPAVAQRASALVRRAACSQRAGRRRSVRRS